MSIDTRVEAYEPHLTDQTVLLQANMHAGNSNPGFSSDWETNRSRNLDELALYTPADRLHQMRPPQTGFGFVDLDLDDAPKKGLLRTEGLITSNPRDILHANPADCGEIAVAGQNGNGTLVIALLHAGIRVVRAGAHKDALDYLAQTKGLDPESMNVRLGPSVRKESYAFPDIEADIVLDPAWQDFWYQDEVTGQYHKDVHGRTVADLRAFGIPDQNISVHPADTAAENSHFFSYTLEKSIGWPVGGNAVYFAMR